MISVACGGALGALARFLLSELNKFYAYPLGTLLVNVIGCVLIGVLAPVVKALDQRWGALLVTGFLGAFTTFSAFSLETIQLMERGEGKLASIHVIANLILCLCGTWIGLQFAASLVAKLKM